MSCTSNTAPDSELVNQLLKRDPLALAAVYDRYAGSVYSLLIRITHDQSKAEDLLQELFLRLWNCPQLFDRKSGWLRTWLLSTARNMAISQVRSRSARCARRVPCTEVMPQHDDATDDRRSAVWRATDASKALASLETREREVLELAYFHGYSQSEIAKLLNQPLENVKTWMQSGLNRARQGLQGSDVRVIEAPSRMSLSSESAPGEQTMPAHKPEGRFRNAISRLCVRL